MTAEDKRLTVKISEHEHGWFYAVYDGDGTVPGSLHSASVVPTLGEAIREGTEQIETQLKIRNCDHSFVRYGDAFVRHGDDSSGFVQCEFCEIVRPLSGAW